MVCNLFEWAVHVDTEPRWTCFYIFASFPWMFFYHCFIWYFWDIRFKQWAHLKHPEYLAGTTSKDGMAPLNFGLLPFNITDNEKKKRIKTQLFLLLFFFFLASSILSADHQNSNVAAWSASRPSPLFLLLSKYGSQPTPPWAVEAHLAHRQIVFIQSRVPWLWYQHLSPSNHLFLQNVLHAGTCHYSAT